MYNNVYVAACGLPCSSEHSGRLHEQCCDECERELFGYDYDGDDYLEDDDLLEDEEDEN